MSEENRHNGDNSEKFEDATDAEDALTKKTNKEIIDEIIQKQSALNLNDSLADSNDNNEDDNFVDCIETPSIEPDEASQRDYECTLSEDELQANQLKADEFKKTGNEHYKNGEFSKSIESYSDGIKICPLRCSNERAVLYGNRAAAYIQLKNNTLAIQDCSKALDLDPNYIKVTLR